MRINHYAAHLFALICVAFATFCSAQTVTPPSTVNVPLVYEDTNLGSTSLSLDYGAPFRKELPTVLVIADGQQFYVQPGSMKELQRSTFGEGVNVVGIVTRGGTPAFLQAALDAQGKPDWLKAWRIFNSREWIGDIESVRKALVGENGKVYLYGRSGGAYLVHQYLSFYGEHVLRAFTQSAVNPYLNAELGIALDTFWTELGQQDPRLQDALQAVLRAHPQDRMDILMTLQRQHFFMPADGIQRARAQLIQRLAAGDLAFYRQARKDYEVDQMNEMYRSNDIIPQDVRVLELIEPSGAFNRLAADRVDPLTETQRQAILPLLQLQGAGKITLPPFDFPALHRVPTQVFVLAGRFDEAVDYRTSIALAAQYSAHQLFIANDNHVFSALSSSGTSSKLVQSFFGSGLGSRSLKETLTAAQPYRWSEN